MVLGAEEEGGDDAEVVGGGDGGVDHDDDDEPGHGGVDGLSGGGVGGLHGGEGGLDDQELAEEADGQGDAGEAEQQAARERPRPTWRRPCPARSSKVSAEPRPSLAGRSSMTPKIPTFVMP